MKKIIWIILLTLSYSVTIYSVEPSTELNREKLESFLFNVFFPLSSEVSSHLKVLLEQQKTDTGRARECTSKNERPHLTRFSITLKRPFNKQTQSSIEALSKEKI